MGEGHTLKKVVTVVSNIILYAFVAVSIIGVLLTLTAKQGKDGTATVLGIQLRYVLSPSMEKSEYTNTDDFVIKDIPQSSVVLVRVVPTEPDLEYEWYDSLEVGDVLTFRYVYTTQETITHRIVDIYEKDDKSGFMIYLEGDNKSSESGALTQVIDTSVENGYNYVIGRVVGVSRVLGFLVKILSSPVGLILAVILPCSAILIFEIFRITSVMGLERREKEAEERKKKEDELNELRRRIAELETKTSSDSLPTSDRDIKS